MAAIITAAQLFGSPAAVIARLQTHDSTKLCKSRAAYPRRRRSGGRVRGWCLDLGVADPLLSVSCESASVPSPCLVFIPCHIESNVRFSLIRLSDNLLPGAFKLLTIPILITCHIRPDQNALSLLALKYSLRWSSRDYSCGVIGLSACTVTYLLA